MALAIVRLGRNTLLAMAPSHGHPKPMSCLGNGYEQGLEVHETN